MMVDAKSDVLRQILDIQVGAESSELTFVRRLQRENDWSESYSSRVVIEYKKFIYLAYLSDDEVTPPDAVDQAWHLHLAYTKSYWSDLCRNILNKEIHHNPTEGGAEQSERFRNQYINTMLLYQQVFAEVPPEDIWPDVDNRFEDASSFVRVNRAKKWLITKPVAHLRNVTSSILLVFLLVACSSLKEDKSGWFWMALIAVIVLVIFVMSWLVRKALGPQDDSRGDGGPGCGGCGAT